MNRRDCTFRGTTRRLLAHLLPRGRPVRFWAYHTLYRDGDVPLPPLAESRRSLTLVPS